MNKLRLAFIAIIGLLIYSVLLSSLVRNIYLTDNGVARYPVIAKPLQFMAEIPSLVKRGLSKPKFMIANSTSKAGVDVKSDSGLENYPNLLVTYKDKPFAQKFDLVDLPSGTILKSWQPDNAALYNAAYNTLNPRKPPEGSDLYFMHPIMLADSSLVFTSQLTSMIARIGSDNDLMWLSNDRTYHHSLEMDADGNLLGCTQPFVSGEYDMMPENFSDYKDNLMDDAITKIDPENGSVLFNKSVIEILLENGYEDLLLYKGQFISDPIHLNDVQPALNDSPFWQKDDLLVSCRNISVVFLYRPATNEVLWLRHGPWYNQHDVDYLNENEIVVFGNDVIREESVLNPKVTKQSLYFNNNRPHNEVYIYNFEKDSIYSPYSKLLAAEKIRTATSGRCDILPNGDLFVEDTNNGRIIFGDTENKKLEYVKRIDDEHISSLFWSRIIY